MEKQSKFEVFIKRGWFSWVPGLHFNCFLDPAGAAFRPIKNRIPFMPPRKPHERQPDAANPTGGFRWLCSLYYDPWRPFVVWPASDVENDNLVIL